ncbi:hypothetical protein RUM44_007411 [Polyplax serrata]|uniref:K Homology domain-containing protein n=1 Tax=Polyplax serrata TaxID=468196 RepID=A0ABR1B128_POLSC
MASTDMNGTTAESEQNKELDKSGESETNSRYEPKTLVYMETLLKEKHVLSTTTYPVASRLLEEELARTKQSGQPARDYRYVDIFREKPMKVVVKVMVPIKEYPKFNFVGKLLGPKGNTLRRLQEETLCKMTILGRGSMKDKTKEEELRQGLDPKYSHLSDDLHVEVSTMAPPSEAHGRMSYALKELRRYLIPDANDEISQEQLRELESYGGVEGNEEAESKPRSNQAPFRGKRPPGSSLPSGASRAKVMSILEKARNAMGNTKGYPSAMHNMQNNYDRRNAPRQYEEYNEDFDPSRFEGRYERNQPIYMNNKKRFNNRH